MKSFYSGATKRWIFPLEMELFAQYTHLETVLKKWLSRIRLEVVFLCVHECNNFFVQVFVPLSIQM